MKFLKAVKKGDAIMGKRISPRKVKRQLGNYTVDELRDLRDSISLELINRGAENELTYSQQQVEVIGERISLEQTAEAQRLINTRIIPYFDAVDKMLSLFVAIDTLMAVGRDYRLMRKQLDGYDRKMTGAFLHLRQIAKNNGWNADFGDLEAAIYDRIEGVQRFLAGQDNGEYLRGIIQENAGEFMRSYLVARAEADMGGRPLGSASGRQLIADTCTRYRQERRVPWGRAANQFWTELNAIPETERTPAQQDAYNRLSWRTDNTGQRVKRDNRGEYVKNLVAKIKKGGA